MASKRGNPVARAGNYAQEVDSVGMDPEMKETLGLGKPKPKTKVKSLLDNASDFMARFKAKKPKK